MSLIRNEEQMTLTTTTLAAGKSLVKRKPKPFRNLVGEIFGRLTVLSRADHPLRPIHWRCACSCGTERVVNGSRLTRGDTRSCGCLRTELTRARMTTHGHTAKKQSSPEFWAWVNMRARCSNPKNPGFKSYGGRGITVEPAWDCRNTGFQPFLDHIGLMPEPGLSLDRIDNDRGYVIGNCRWATKHTQVRNRRSNRWIEGLGSKRIISDWAELLKVSPSKLSNALKHFGELLFAVMAIRPSFIGMQSQAEHEAELDAAERTRKEREEGASFVVETI
jgi:hypothetical protein